MVSPFKLSHISDICVPAFVAVLSKRNVSKLFYLLFFRQGIEAKIPLKRFQIPESLPQS